MSWLTSLGFGNLAAGALAALSIPIVVFYFLKLRRPKAEVPSLALWRRVVNDKRVNSPFQKFRRNLLLLLQLLWLAALTFAAMQPFLNAGAGRAEYRVLLIDTSASMAATDAGGRSRLDLAKERAEEIVDGLRSGQQVAVIAFDRYARTLQEFTDNPTLLNAALDRLETKDVESDLGDALRLAGALARTAPVTEGILLTDGNLPSAEDVDLAFPVNYQRLPSAGPNVGVVALNARRSGTGAAADAGWDLFVKLAASEATGASVELYGEAGPEGGEPLATESVGFDRADDSPRLVFEIPANGPRAVTVRIVSDGTDSLPADNAAGLVLPPPRPLTAYCPPSQEVFRKALEFDRGAVSLFPRPDDQGPPSFDLAVVDQPDTPETPAPDAVVRLFVGLIPEDLRGLIETKVGYAEVVDWRQTAPALEHVQLREVQITDEPTYVEQPNGEPATAADLEQLGYEVLIDARTGPLMLRRREGARVDYHLLFDPATSTLPYRVAFPIFVQNLIREATRAAALSEVRAVKTGSLPPVDLGEANREATVVGPDGTRTLTADGGGMLTAVPAEAAGLYTITASGGPSAGEPAATFTAGVLSPLETSLAGVEKLKLNEVQVAVAEEAVATDRPLWHWLAAGAFVLLLAEWWAFHRRPAV